MNRLALVVSVLASAFASAACAREQPQRAPAPSSPVDVAKALIERDPRVTVLYFDPSGPGYVSLAGSAAIVRDPVEKARRWKDSWVGFYKDRNRGDDYTLIRVSATKLEISSPSQNMVTWQPVTVAIGKD